MSPQEVLPPPAQAVVPNEDAADWSQGTPMHAYLPADALRVLSADAEPAPGDAEPAPADAEPAPADAEAAVAS